MTDRDFQHSVFAWDLLKEIPPEKALPLLIEHIKRLETEVADVKKVNAEQTREQRELRKDVKEILAIFQASKGFIRTFKTVGDVFKWLCAVAAAVAGAYYTWKGLGE